VAHLRPIQIAINSQLPLKQVRPARHSARVAEPCCEYAPRNNVRPDKPRLLVGTDRQRLKWRLDVVLRQRCLAINWSRYLDTLLCITVSARVCGTRGFPRGFSLYQGSHPSGKNNKGKMVRGRHIAYRRGNHSDFARARRGEGGRVFRACSLGCTPTTRKVLGTRRRNEPRSPLA
jgi:hypothetical protein